MTLCKYCGKSLEGYQSEFCDIVCEKMYKRQNGELSVKRKRKKKSDKFDDYIREQKTARDNGSDMSYGDYQKAGTILMQKVHIDICKAIEDIYLTNN